MNRQILIMLFLLFCFSTAVSGSDQYKKFNLVSNEDYLIKISFSNGRTEMTMFGDTGEKTINFNETDFKLKGDSIFIKNVPFYYDGNFIFHDGVHSDSEVSNVKLETGEDGKIEISLMKRSDKLPPLMAEHKKNEIGLDRKVIIRPGQFLRGSVMTFWSDIEIDGEVNGSVIAIFGNVKIGDEAIVRGDVLAINGSVEHGKNSTVYGSVRISGLTNKKRTIKSWRLKIGQGNISTIERFYYNRVDGAAPYLGGQYFKPDSSLPEITAFAGYGFASERWRFHIGLKQYLLKNKALRIGVSYYKKLASNDDWIINEKENTLFALLATEDYKDYYEAEGGYFFGQYQFPYEINLEIGFQIEKNRWLDAHSGLWSLAGGSKEFQQNFSTVDLYPYRTEAIDLMEKNKFKSLTVKCEYNQSAQTNYPVASFFTARANLEWTPSEWNDSLDYTRFWAEASRYQKINRNSALILRMTYGKIDGDISPNPFGVPIHKLFSLGGLGTFHGYQHKEYYGTEFWLADIEYGINFPTSSWTTWLFYEAGQIGVAGNLSDAEVKNSIGLGFSFHDMIRMNISKRLDRSGDSPKLYIRLKRQF